jgi:1,2-diacylglycerol 3-beta-galactosyltransferase
MGKRMPGSWRPGLRRFRLRRTFREASAQLYRGDAALGPKRFLFLFSDTGGGHRASAQAVSDEMARLYGAAVSVDMVDLFIELDQWPFDRFPSWYPTCVGLSGIPWGLGFHLSDRKRLVSAMSRLVWPYTRSALCDVLERYPADVIASFHPIPNHTLLMALRHLGWQTPVAIVTLDMVTAHAGWFVPGADRYTVPTQAAKARALRWGLPEERIVVTGMPTRRRFLLTIDLSRGEARQQLGLPQEIPVVLIVGGGEGMGPLAQVVRAIGRRRPHAHIVVITGRNNALREEISRMELPVPIQVEGFVSNMEIWMRAADILVTKAGPNTLSEAFVAGLPIVLYTALPGQEQGNVQHVIENGAGCWAPLPRQAARAVTHLLDVPSARRAMAARSRSLACPLATEQIARSLWDLGYSRTDTYQELLCREHILPVYS